MRVKSHRLLKKNFASYMYYIEYQRVITHERKTMSLFQYGGREMEEVFVSITLNCMSDSIFFCWCWVIKCLTKLNSIHFYDVTNVRRDDNITMLYSTTWCWVIKCMTKFNSIHFYSTRS